MLSILGIGHGNNPNAVKTEEGSGADKSCIQPKKGACRISMDTDKTLYSEKNTGIKGYLHGSKTVVVGY